MTICRLIAPSWLLKKNPSLPKVLEGIFTAKQLTAYNRQGYNIYHLPNYPSQYDASKTVDGADIDLFTYVFVDMDLKDQVYANKDDFFSALSEISLPPSKVVDSGNGIHTYWKVSNLDAKSYLRFQRRLMRLLHTDPAVGQLFQLMRLPGYLNTKVQDNQPLCELLFEENVIYAAEELDRLLPPILKEDEDYCNQHYDKTFNLNQSQIEISEELPANFGKLLKNNKEVKDLWANDTDDRSKNDFRLGHLMFANDFTKDEALSVLVNSAKALQRAPVHRRSYAENIVNKIWTFESSSLEENPRLSMSVADILRRSGISLEGQRFPCYKYIDDTECGFRLGHVLGLVAGAGVGKTAMTLNIFMGFVTSNPEYVHFFVPLEQTDSEIASRWLAMCGSNTRLHDRVQILSNYDSKGKFRDLSLEEIKEHILKFTKETGDKVGCVVIDHIGVLCNDNKLGQDEGVKRICKAMKGFAIETNTFLIMQSQTSREKAGIGDLELNKDAAFGTSVFENFCDFMVTLWQPLKRVYTQGAPTVVAYKFCKIRHKKQGVDVLLEDIPYTLYFNPGTQLLRQLTQDEEVAFKYFLSQATNKRKADRKTELVEYISVKWGTDESDISGSATRTEIRKTNLSISSKH